ncbi:MAG: DUF1045 domain-containing protein [Alphaproteobacteria bacterium]|nr:DUF1045 domain-containing protein [Alphaproteobacteria bacterium]
MTARYALYYAPQPDEALAVFGRHWLGRDVDRGVDVERLAVDGVSAADLAAATSDPRHYGFHGTLKPPFALATGHTVDELLDAAAAFARRRPGFPIERLELRVISGFIALVPHAKAPTLDALAADCVRDFDRFRAPADATELAKRRASRLTPRQDELLVQWGYPYVMEEFRFHLTLTGRLAEPMQSTILRALRPLTAPFCAAPVAIRDIVIFQQPDRTAPFSVLARCPLTGG